MEPVTLASTTAPTTVSPFFGVDVFSLFGSLFGNTSAGGILGFLNSAWSIYAIIAYLVCIFFLFLYVYASVQKNLYSDLQTQMLRDAERLYDEQYRGVSHSSRLNDVFTHLESENPNDWKLAIIEADIILDDTLKKRGYVGNSLGERLKTISPEQLNSLSDAWEAHKVRNRIAHDGADFVLTKRIAQETIVRYQKVFSEFGVS
ncbi:MAG: hypothetical protein RLZZ230_510 [Candidatus Parcubacteria bacterium]|jgi:uncharacterized membrane protein